MFRNIQASYIEAIQRKYPDFAVHSASLSRRGQNNDVLLLNDAFIFRFPRHTGGIKKLETETALLKDIQEQVTLAVPGFTFENLATQDVGEVFVGYRMIAGEPLWCESLQTIHDEQTLEALAGQLATFLKALHAIPVEKISGCHLPICETLDECVDIYTRIRDKCFPYMRQDACDWAMHHFENFLNNPHRFEYEPVLRHGDFGASNILYDGQKQVINGIIDFGEAGLGDPAYDFAGLLSSYGEAFVRRCSTFYPDIEAFWTRMQFYQDTFALVEALFGLENNDKEAFESGIAQYV